MKKVYDSFIATLKARNWNYDEGTDDRGNRKITLGVRGDDLPMRFVIRFDESRKLVVFHSFMNFEFGPEKRVEGALACCMINYNIVNGAFDYDISDGSVLFRMVCPVHDTVPGQETFDYMINCSCSTIDQYNDKLLAISKGYMSLDEFNAEIHS
ncbi:MAG: YbjN domain-containing protein [Clostridia bacterium]|nr:YbjN domain-containing protein [Clostridia bacterium]